MIMNPQSSSVGQRLRKRNQWFQNKYYFWKIGQKIIKYLTSIPFYGIHDLYQICVCFLNSNWTFYNTGYQIQRGEMVRSSQY